jgi:hypothetical protein
LTSDVIHSIHKFAVEAEGEIVFTLLITETAQIQHYIFNSNRLKENVGASYLVAATTEKWVCDLVQESHLSHNLDDIGGFTKRTIDEHGLDIEVLYCGGGNAVLLFRDESYAKHFAHNLSRRAITDAPGLRLTFYQQNIHWEDGDVFENEDQKRGVSYAVSHALKQMKTQRSKQPPQTGIAGLSVTAMCASSSLPATVLDRDPDDNWQAISAEVHAKRKAVDDANMALNALLGEVQNRLSMVKENHLEDEYRFALELDDLGRTKGESSFIAVVHADGNDMGMLIQGLKTHYPDPQHNREYIDHMRGFSENVKQASRAALIEMLVLLMLSIREKDGGRVIHGIYDQADIQLKRDKQDSNKWILPFRPLVSGGDDITFVCDGRIGLDMAVRFIEAFEYKTQEILRTRLTACAGIAIVNAHYPFARAYELAEELCQSAKKERHNSGKTDSSLIDWHYTSGGLYDDLDGMRQREYTVSKVLLHLRPLFLDDNAHEYRTWRQVQRVATEFQTKWRDHRSKAKGFMDALRGGEETATAFQKRYINGTDISLPLINGIKDRTWSDDGRCLYFDALELMDLYIPITQGEAEHVSED